MMCAITSIASYAQAESEHMKFMGIPLTGSITSFQTKLIAKGFKADKELNKTLPIGCRSYDGTFAGNEAQIFVYYDKDSKNVYRAKAVITTTDEDIAEQKYREFESMLQTKYSDAYIDKGTNDGYDALAINIQNNENTYFIGRVDLFRTDNRISVYNQYPSYNIHIDYHDMTNSRDNLDNKMDDL